MQVWLQGLYDWREIFPIFSTKYYLDKRTKGPVAHLIDFLIVSLKVTMQSMVESHLRTNPRPYGCPCYIKRMKTIQSKM